MAKPENCFLCAEGAQIDPTDNFTEMGRTYGTSRDTIRRHVLHSTPEDSVQYGQGRVVSRKTSTKHADGSWDSVTVRYDDIADPQELTELALSVQSVVREVFAQPSVEIVSDGRTGPFTKMFSPSDLQLGKVDVNGGTKETLERVHVALQAFIDDLDGTRPAEILVPDLGDVIENFFNTASQMLTNDLDIVEQVLAAGAIMSTILRALSPLTDRLVFITVPSNHCQVRFERGKGGSGKPSQDYGLLVHEMLRRELEGRPEYAHVVFLKPRNEFEEFVVYYSEVSNTKLGFIHGHQTKGVFKIGEWLEGQVMDKSNPLSDVDILIAGHYHSYTVYMWKTRQIIVVPSADNGSSWFTSLTGQKSPAGILACTIINGRSFDHFIY